MTEGANPSREFGLNFLMEVRVNLLVFKAFALRLGL